MQQGRPSQQPPRLIALAPARRVTDKPDVRIDIIHCALLPLTGLPIYLSRSRAGLVRPPLVQAFQAVRLQRFGVDRGVPREDVEGQGLRACGGDNKKLQ